MDIYGAKLMEFEKYLKSNKLVPENKINYFSNWADKFLHGINYNVAAIDQNSIICFINSLRKDQRYEDWQIRQAESAVRIYVRNFRLPDPWKKPMSLFFSCRVQWVFYAPRSAK
jgi:hypothetical protein